MTRLPTGHLRRVMRRAPCSLMFTKTTASLMAGPSAASRLAAVLVAVRGSVRPVCMSLTSRGYGLNRCCLRDQRWRNTNVGCPPVLALMSIKRGISLPHQLLQRHGFGGIEMRHTHTQGQFVAAFGARAVSQLGLQPAADRFCTASGCLDDQGHKFIATQAGGHLNFAKSLLDARRRAR